MNNGVLAMVEREYTDTIYLLEQWGSWSRGDLGLGLGRNGVSASVCCADDVMLSIDRKIARMGKEKPFPARVIRTKYLNPDLGDNGEPVPRSDLIVAAMLRLTQTDVNSAILSGIRFIECE